MTDINVAFSREVLKETMVDIKRVTSPKERKDAWVWKSQFGSWEFHGPEGYYWFGDADNAYDARAKGWTAWWEKIKSDGATMRARLAGKDEREARAMYERVGQ